MGFQNGGEIGSGIPVPPQICQTSPSSVDWIDIQAEGPRSIHLRVVLHDGGEVGAAQRRPHIRVGVLPEGVQVVAHAAREQNWHLPRPEIGSSRRSSGTNGMRLVGRCQGEHKYTNEGTARSMPGE